MWRNRMSCLKRYFVFVWVVPVLLLGIYQTCVLGDILPGTYKITFDQLENVSDKWVFYKDGTFKSEGFGVTSTWQMTGPNTFEISADKQEIKGFIMETARLVGLTPQDVKISIKTLQITGVDKKGKISGDMQTDYLLKIKKPFTVHLTTKGTEKFEGELIN